MSRVARAPRCTEDKSPLCLLRRRSRSLGRIGFVGRGKCRRERNCFALSARVIRRLLRQCRCRSCSKIASGFKSAEVTSATLSAADAALARRHRYFRRRLVHDCRPGWELVAQLYSGCGRKVVSNSGVVPSERYRKFGLSAGANEIRNLGLAVYGPRRGRAANRHLARGPELNTGPQPVVPGSPFGSTPAETFVRVGPSPPQLATSRRR